MDYQQFNECEQLWIIHKIRDEDMLAVYGDVIITHAHQPRTDMSKWDYLH